MSTADSSMRAFLVMTNVDPEDWCAVLDATRKVIGRGAASDIRVSPRFRYVSRRHAEVWAEPRRLNIRDLGSAAGTHINGVWVEDGRDAHLDLGDRLWMGGLELEVTGEVSTLAQVVAERGEPMENAVAPAGPMGSSPTLRGTISLPTRFQLAELSQAELEIMLWMGRGVLDDEELGKKLFRSPNTVRTQMNSIFRKLDLHSRAEVVSWLKRGK